MLLIDKKWKQRAWIILFMLSAHLSIVGQSTFNVRLTTQLNTSLNSIHITENGYISSGWTTDTIGGYHFDMLFYSLDANGNVIDSRRYGEPNRMFWSIGNSSSEIPNYYVQQSIGPRSDTAAVNYTWYNQLGDTLFTKDFRSIYLGDGSDQDYFITPPFAFIKSDSCTFISTNVFGANTFNDAVLYKLDPQGHELWHYVHATLSDPDGIYAVVPHQGGVIVAISEYGFVENNVVNEANNLIVKLDANGNELWSLNSDDHAPGSRDSEAMIVDQDSIVIAGIYEAPNLVDVYPIASIYKIDTLGNLVWSNTYAEYVNFEWRKFNSLVQTTDGHYVCGGTWTTTPGSEPVPINQTNPDFDQFAHIVKFNRDNGAIIWERQYRWLETYRDYHTLSDMKATPDGGVVFCGEALDLYLQLDPPYQQGWVAKLDACGCLVPGCDETCIVGVEEMRMPASRFKVGPNPASDILNVYLSPQANKFKAETLSLYSLTGQLMQSFQIKHFDTTYMMDVSSLAIGEYVLVLSAGNEILEQQKIVVK